MPLFWFEPYGDRAIVRLFYRAVTRQNSTSITMRTRVWLCFVSSEGCNSQRDGSTFHGYPPRLQPRCTTSRRSVQGRRVRIREISILSGSRAFADPNCAICSGRMVYSSTRGGNRCKLYGVLRKVLPCAALEFKKRVMRIAEDDQTKPASEAAVNVRQIFVGDALVYLPFSLWVPKPKVILQIMIIQRGCHVSAKSRPQPSHSLEMEISSRVTCSATENAFAQVRVDDSRWLLSCQEVGQGAPQKIIARPLPSRFTPEQAWTLNSNSRSCFWKCTSMT